MRVRKIGIRVANDSELLWRARYKRHSHATNVNAIAVRFVKGIKIKQGPSEVMMAFVVKMYTRVYLYTVQVP